MNWPEAMVVLSIIWVGFFVWMVRTMLKNTDEKERK